MAVLVVGVAILALRHGDERVTVAPSDAAPPGALGSPSPLATAASLPASAPADAGPTTMVGGVPMGYAHNGAGAEAAGVGFLRLDASLVAMTDAEASAAKRVIASSAAADGLVADLVAKLDALRKGYPGGPTLYRIGALAARVAAAGADRARVEIWYVGVVSPPGAVPYEEWTTQRYELVWERNDWREAGEASTPGPRPLPLPRADPSGPGQLEAALAGFGPVAAGR